MGLPVSPLGDLLHNGDLAKQDIERIGKGIMTFPKDIILFFRHIVGVK